MNKIITITKPHNEAFILNGKEYELLSVACTIGDLREAMSAVAKELLHKPVYEQYEQVFMEAAILSSIMKSTDSRYL